MGKGRLLNEAEILRGLKKKEAEKQRETEQRDRRKNQYCFLVL